MAGLSKHLALALFNMALNPSRAAFTPPASLWLALHTAAPSDSSYGSEATYEGYARQPMDSLTSTALAEVAGNVDIEITNGNAVVFPPSTSATGQTITHWAIWDNQTAGAGNILVSGHMASPRLITNGDAVVIPDGNIEIALR